MKMYCPKCKNFVPVEEHEYPDRVEYICSKCGFKIKVKHKPLFEKPKTEIRWEFMPSYAGQKPIFC